jgi:hypothetical protein
MLLSYLRDIRCSRHLDYHYCRNSNSSNRFCRYYIFASQFVKEEVNAGAELPFTAPSKINNVLPIDLEVVFVVIGVIGFGIFIYGFATRVNKPLDFYPV